MKSQYGLPNNESRPGGAQYTATYYIKSANGEGKHTVKIIADHDSLLDIASIFGGFISSHADALWNKAVLPIEGVIAPFDTAPVKPEQIWTYLRASTAGLSIDEYNNTAVFDSNDRAASGSPLPSFIDREAVACVRDRLISNLPLVDAPAVDAAQDALRRMPPTHFVLFYFALLMFLDV